MNNKTREWDRNREIGKKQCWDVHSGLDRFRLSNTSLYSLRQFTKHNIGRYHITRKIRDLTWFSKSAYIHTKEGAIYYNLTLLPRKTTQEGGGGELGYIKIKDSLVFDAQFKLI